VDTYLSKQGCKNLAMFAIKRELKLNKVETSLMRGNAGFKRFVYNYGLELLTTSWSFEDVKASDSKRIDAIKKVLTQVTMQKPEYAWMREYPSTVYQSAFIDLKDAFSRWRKGLGDFPKKKSKKKGDSFSNAPKYLAVRYAVANTPYKIGYFFNWKSVNRLTNRKYLVPSNLKLGAFCDVLLIH
jgi:transposase